MGFGESGEKNQSCLELESKSISHRQNISDKSQNQILLDFTQSVQVL